MNIRSATLILSLAFLAIGTITCKKNTSDKPSTTATDTPNIILIYADDVGYGDISSYGAQSIATPHIDQLAKKGVRFTNAHSAASTCTPSRYALLTGRYAWRAKNTGIARGNAPLLIDISRTTIADVMKKAGYKTAVIGKWHLGLGPAPEGPNWNEALKPGPLELGFDYSFIIPATPDAFQRCMLRIIV